MVITLYTWCSRASDSCPTSLPVSNFLIMVRQKGAGEIINSVDRDGLGSGYELNLLLNTVHQTLKFQ